MKLPGILAVFTAVVGLSVPASSAITADELARFLGVSAWSTKVSLPAESFVAELYTINDGVADQRILEGMPAWNNNPEKGLVVMSGTENGKYKIVLAYGDGVTMSVGTDVSTFRGTSAPSLPKEISEGTYVLFGEPKAGGKPGPAEDISGFAKGFLLRIRKVG